MQGDWFFEREKELMLGFGADQSFDSNLLLLYQHDLKDGRWIRGGSFSTYRLSKEAMDTLVRTGLLLSTGNAKSSHNLVVQPYLYSRSFHYRNAPYLAYAFKLQR